MANLAYASLWCRNLTEATMAEAFASLLATVPFSAARPGFEAAVLRAVDPGQALAAEHDMRGNGSSAEEVVELVRDGLRADAALEARAWWDLWVFDLARESWQEEPHPLDLVCRGEEYDERAFEQTGHFHAVIGFEHLFTGHAGLLAPHRREVAEPQHAEEARFLEAMSAPGRLREYQEKTVANVQKLFGWLRRLEKTGRVERALLWSEGEENFESRVEEILSQR
jgi:hypothetical protein